MTHPLEPFGAAAVLHGVPVLVVENDLTDAGRLSMLLADLACDVRVVRNAEEARALLRVFRARIVLVNLVLPRMSGLLLVRTLKADPATSDIIVIAMTFIDEPGTERLAREVGCAALVLKPVNTQAVVGTLLQHVSADSVTRATAAGRYGAPALR